MRNLVVVACLAGCATHAEPVAPAAAIEPPTPEISAQHADAIRVAAADFTKWGRVDERLNVAPWLCSLPTREDCGQPVPARSAASRVLTDDSAGAYSTTCTTTTADALMHERPRRIGKLADTGMLE